MKQLPFEQAREKDWAAYQQELEKVKRGKKSDSFPRLYRRVTHHLALAIDRGYSEQLVKVLEQFVVDGHGQFYKNTGVSQHRCTQYFTQHFPQAVRRYRTQVFISALAFILPVLLTHVILKTHPHYIYAIMGDQQLQQFGEMYDPIGKVGATNETSSQLQMWGFYIYNNVSIDFKCYASGLLLGMGSIFYMMFNGFFFGAASSYIQDCGYQSTFYSFVIGHSALEITAMILSGASGIVMGQALLFPGRRTLLQALQYGAREGMSLLMGAALMTFFAAFIEAYWSSRVDISHTYKYILGASQWSLVLLYFLRMGRSTRAS